MGTPKASLRVVMYCAGVSCQMRVLVTPRAAPGKNSDPSATLAEDAVPPGPPAPAVPAVLDDECWPWLSVVQAPIRTASPTRLARTANDQFDRHLDKRIGNVRHSATDSNGSTALHLANHLAWLCWRPTSAGPQWSEGERR
jgi:hypothetical protein